MGEAVADGQAWARRPRKVQGEDPARKRADELHQQGMPYQMAMAVAQGRLDLSEALERMARKERVQKLMDRHDLSRALATQVALGHADLERVLARRRMEEHRAEHRERTCLTVADGPVALQLAGRLVKGTITEVDPYAFTIETGGTSETVHKLEARFGYDPVHWKAVKKAVKADKSGDPEARPATRPQDRQSCSDKRLFGYLDGGSDALVTLIDGTTMRGRVTWFGRYEFGLEVKAGVEITVFRHALSSIRRA